MLAPSDTSLPTVDPNQSLPVQARLTSPKRRPNMRVPTTLYLIADGGRARYVERTGPGSFATFRKFVSAHIHEKAAALGHAGPARIKESATNARHGIEAH